MNTSKQQGTGVKQGEICLLSLVPMPVDASEKTVRLCDTELDAIAVSLVLSHLPQAEIARRMNVSRSYLTMLKTGERRMSAKLLPIFCTATGSNLVRQYRAMHSAIRAAQGRARATDRIESIASFSRRAA